MQETGLTIFRSYPGQEYQTICRRHSLGGSTLSSDTLRPRVMVQSSLKPSISGALQRELTRQRYLRAYRHFIMLFTHITDTDTPDTIDTWGAVTCQTTQSSFDEIRE